MPGRTSAKKQWLYRARRDENPDRREIYLQKRREKYISDRESGKRKPIKELSGREQRKQRREWRKNQQRSRTERQKVLLTPPNTPDEEPSR